MGILNEIRGMLLLSAFAFLIVLFAMIVDGFSGWFKAKQRGEAHKSYLLVRSMNKFILYEGGLMIATGVDILIHFTRLLRLFGLEIIDGVPLVCCVAGIFLLRVEYLSLREKAEDKMKKDFEKAKKDFEKAAVILSQIFTKEELKEILLKKMQKEETNDDRS